MSFRPPGDTWRDPLWLAFFSFFYSLFFRPGSSCLATWLLVMPPKCAQQVTPWHRFLPSVKAGHTMAQINTFLNKTSKPFYNLKHFPQLLPLLVLTGEASIWVSHLENHSLCLLGAVSPFPVPSSPSASIFSLSLSLFFFLVNSCLSL